MLQYFSVVVLNYYCVKVIVLLAEALYQRGVAQASWHAGNILESVVPHVNTLAVPGKGKNNQVQRMESTRQGESGSKDSQGAFLHIWAPGQPHTKGL